MTKRSETVSFSFKVLFSVGVLTFGYGQASIALAQGLGASQGSLAPQGSINSRGIEKSDIRRGFLRAGDLDSDGDGLGDAARQADLKKLADELVNSHRTVNGGAVNGSRALNGAGVAGNGNGAIEDPAAQKRVKMKKLKPTEVTLEPIEEIDGCPTLPCP